MQITNDDSLIVPHPRIIERRFVTRPLRDIAAAFVHPDTNQSIAQLDAIMERNESQSSTANPSINKVLSIHQVDRCLPLGNRTWIMGILNATPDSFSDGGTYSQSLTASLEHAAALIEQGADIIDIGGASTRPNAAVVTVEQELETCVAYHSSVARETSSHST